MLVLESLFYSFLDACAELPDRAFQGKSGVFTISIYDAVFAAICRAPLDAKSHVKETVDITKLNNLKADTEFADASQSRTAGKGNVKKRLERATALLR